MPLAPLPGKATAFAASSVRLKASTDEISGLGAPARTATPRPARPISAREPATILPSLISASITGGLSTATSKLSPASIFIFQIGVHLEAKVDRVAGRALELGAEL